MVLEIDWHTSLHDLVAIAAKDPFLESKRFSSLMSVTTMLIRGQPTHMAKIRAGDGVSLLFGVENSDIGAMREIEMLLDDVD